MWILRILGPIKFCKGPIKNSNGPLKFGNLRVFEWDMGHWPILTAHHHFGLRLSLHGCIKIVYILISWFLQKLTGYVLQLYTVFKNRVKQTIWMELGSVFRP